MTLRLKTAVSALALFPLVACGGGGGGGIAGGAPVTGGSATTSSTTTSTTADSSSGSTTPVVMSPSTSSATTSQTAAGDPGTVPALVGPAETNTVTITTAADGTQTMDFNIRSSGGDYSHTFTLPAGIQPDTFVTVQESQNAQGNVEHQLTLKNLSYSTFGVWQLNNDDGSGVSGAFAQGQDTPIANMPTTGTATYNGSTVAQVTSAGTTGTMTGGAALTADFGKGTIAGNFTNFTGSGKSLSDLTMNATITGNSFAGGVQSTDNALTGNGAGAFRGPQYNEVAGTYAAGGGTTSVVGAFGARKQ